MCIQIVFLALIAIIVVDAEYTSGTPHASVVTLGNDSIDDALKDPANSIWLLKFYAPWCGHCKKLAPILDKAATRLEGKLAIGTIDCTVEKKLCETHDVRAYPTLKFVRDGVFHDYTSGRTEDDFVKFAFKMSAPSVSEVDSYDQALSDIASQNDEGVAFLAYHPAIAEHDKIRDKLQSNHITQVFTQVARKLQHLAHFTILLKSEDVSTKLGMDADAAKNGFIVKIEKGLPPMLFKPTQPDFTAIELLDFVKENNFALVTDLGPRNFNTIGKKGRHLVIGVVDSSDESQVNVMKKELIEFATTGPSDVVSKYYYGTMDGKKWAKFMSQFEVEVDELPQVIVIDVPTKMYWRDPSYESIQEFIMAVAEDKVEMKQSIRAKGGNFLKTLADVYVSNMPATGIATVFAMIIVLLLIRIVTADDEPYPTDIAPATSSDEGAAESKKEQ